MLRDQTRRLVRFSVISLVLTAALAAVAIGMAARQHAERHRQIAATFRALIAPLAHCLRTTDTRVPFSDWYDTKSGRFVSFIARSVQGGLYMPMLVPKKP